MYTQFFRLTQAPFSIAPDPRYLFMSERHREALAHLLYGIDSGGGIVLLTGEIGTGKTTICRCFLEQVPANCNLAYIFNPKLTVAELLRSICEEFHIEPQPERQAAGAKDDIDALNRYLLASHAQGCNNVLVIDEAQNLSAEVLEQLRLLTNLETNERKLLQIILIGQPELRAMLARPELEQLAQRVIAHYHLTALSEQETASYIQHRLATAGQTAASPFQQPLMKQIHRLTRGVPRRINLLCDRALLGAYAKGVPEVDHVIVEQAASELFINNPAVKTNPESRKQRPYLMPALMAAAMAAGAAGWALADDSLKNAARDAWAASGTALKKVLAWRVAGQNSNPALDPAANPVPASVPNSATTSTPPAAQGGIETVAATAALPASAKPATVLADRVDASRTGLRAESEAMRQLALMWNAALPDGDPCEAAKTANLRCHKSSGGFAELGRLDRPAVITLYDAAGKPYPALLTHLGDDAAVLRAGETEQTVRLAVLARHFRGEFATLWRTPPGFGEMAQLGDRGPAVDWVAAQLAVLSDAQTPASGEAFSPQMVKQVRQLQQAHGLFVDGVVGPATAMQLNRVAGVAEPRLRGAPPARRGQPATGE